MRQNPGLYCQVCGRVFEVDFMISAYEGRVCGVRCWIELMWRKHLYLLGEEYRAACDLDGAYCFNQGNRDTIPLLIPPDEDEFT